MAVPNPIIVSTGRRPIIDYVTKDYDGFRQAMLNHIPLLLPNWTDRSETDFGIVLIELFAYVADILSYYQDRVANEAYLDTATQRRSVTELLRLIDYQIGPGLAASAYIHFDTAADVNVTGAQIPYSLKTGGVPGEPDRIFEIFVGHPVQVDIAEIQPVAGLDARGPLELPTADDAVDNAVSGVQQRFAAPDRQLVEPGGLESLRQCAALRVDPGPAEGTARRSP